MREVVGAVLLTGASLFASHAGASSPPIFTQLGPYGDALALAPTAPLAGQSSQPYGQVAFGSTGSAARAIVNPAKVFSTQSKTGSRDEDDEDDEDDDASPSRPGGVSRSFARTPDPTPNLRNRSIGPHLSPNAELQVTDRASLGFIGALDSLDGRTSSSAAALTGRSTGSTTSLATSARTGLAPTAQRAKDLGFGLSLEYRFGK